MIQPKSRLEELADQFDSYAVKHLAVAPDGPPFFEFRMTDTAYDALEPVIIDYRDLALLFRTVVNLSKDKK